MWEQQDRHPGDRERFFTAIEAFTGQVPVLYPGSYVDIAASRVFDRVVYVDADRWAERFFDDEAGVSEVIGRSDAAWRFIHSDYTGDLGLEDRSFGLLVSLYAGFVSEACGRYLRGGGWLLANPSHGDVALASIDPRFELAAVVTSRSGDYRVQTDSGDDFLIPKSGVQPTLTEIRSAGRGIAYTRSPFAYLFRKE